MATDSVSCAAARLCPLHKPPVSSGGRWGAGPGGVLTKWHALQCRRAPRGATERWAARRGGSHAPIPGMHWKGGRSPRGRLAYAQPLSPWRQVPASMAFVTDSNRPQPLRQPPPTALKTIHFCAQFRMWAHHCPPPPPLKGGHCERIETTKRRTCSGPVHCEGSTPPMPLWNALGPHWASLRGNERKAPAKSGCMGGWLPLEQRLGTEHIRSRNETFRPQRGRGPLCEVGWAGGPPVATFSPAAVIGVH